MSNINFEKMGADLSIGIVEEVRNKQVEILKMDFKPVYNNYPLDDEDFKLSDREEALEDAKEEMIVKFRLCFSDKQNRALIEIEKIINGVRA